MEPPSPPPTLPPGIPVASYQTPAAHTPVMDARTALAHTPSDHTTPRPSTPTHRTPTPNLPTNATSFPNTPANNIGLPSYATPARTTPSPSTSAHTLPYPHRRPRSAPSRTDKPFDAHGRERTISTSTGVTSRSGGSSSSSLMGVGAVEVQGGLDGRLARVLRNVPASALSGGQWARRGSRWV